MQPTAHSTRLRLKTATYKGGEDGAGREGREGEIYAVKEKGENIERLG